MNKKGISSTHFRFFLGLKIESTRPVNCRMHYVCAISEFIGCSGQRANIDDALFSGVIESISRTRVPVGIDSVLSWSSNEAPCVLVVVVGHRWAWGKRGTAAFSTGVVAGESGLDNRWEEAKNSILESVLRWGCECWCCQKQNGKEEYS
jgi:hypothetical protein